MHSGQNFQKFFGRRRSALPKTPARICSSSDWRFWAFLGVHSKKIFESLLKMTLMGRSWECTPRKFLKSANGVQGWLKNMHPTKLGLGCLGCLWGAPLSKIFRYLPNGQLVRSVFNNPLDQCCPTFLDLGPQKCKKKFWRPCRAAAIK